MILPIRMSMERAVGWIIGVGVAAACLVVAVVDDPRIAETAWLVLVTLAAGAVFGGAWRRRPRKRLPWVLIGTALGLWALNNLLLHPSVPPAPEWVYLTAGVLELVAFPIIGAAGLVMVRAQHPGGDRESALDATIVMVAIATALPGALTGELAEVTVLSALVALFAPVAMAGISTASLRLLLTGVHRVPATWLLVAASVLALFGQVGRTAAVASGTYQRFDAVDLLIAAAYGCIAIAAVHPSMVALTDITPRSDARSSAFRFLLLGSATLTPPVVMLSRGTIGVGGVVASTLIGLLVLLRLRLLVAERERVRDQMRHVADHDDLTGLVNRRGLLDHLNSLGAAGATAVLFVDLDDFKAINDEHGHAVGDQVLCEVANRLRAACDPADLIARLAGDEFVVVTSGCTPVGVRRLADRVAASLRVPAHVDVGPLRISASIGLASGWTEEAGEAPSASVLLSRSDIAMYAAKSAGPGRWVAFDELSDGLLGRSARIERDLRGAAGRGELRLVYQPVFAVGGVVATDLVGVEALVRWDHPEMGLISPIELLAVADATGLVEEVGAWVVATSCHQLRRWIDGGADPDLHLYVNVSARQITNGDALVAQVAGALDAAGLAPTSLTLEITETAVLDSLGCGAAVLERVRAMGVGIALDDFGTGFSSLTHLRTLPLTALKIDASFVRDLPTCPQDRAIVTALVSIAAELGIDVIAEGVEFAAQRDALELLGCRLLQGFHLAAPMAAEELGALVQEIAAIDGTPRRALTWDDAERGVPQSPK